MKRAIFVYNPVSGEGEIDARIDQITDIYQRHNYIVTLLRIARHTGLSPLTDMITRLEPAHILIAGGDGTVNRLVNFLVNNHIKTPVAVLPTGTANDFATMLGIGSDPIGALKSLLAGKELSVDLGRVGDRYFVNVLSCGLMCDISQRTSTVLKNTFGRVAYYFSSITELPNFRKMNITVESAELTYRGACLMVLIFNGRSAGNFTLARGANLTDGLLDVLIIKGENIVNTIGMLFHFLLQRKGSYPDDVVYFRTNRLLVTLEGENVATDVDGEQGGEFPLDVECLPGALRVLVP